MAEAIVCNKDGCGRGSNSVDAKGRRTPFELFDGWCEEHRWGFCETPGCGKRAVGRVALSELEEGDNGQLQRRFVGNPLACDDCTDLKKRAAKVAKAA